MSTTDREKQLRRIAQDEAHNWIDNYDWFSLVEGLDMDYEDDGVTDDEAEYIYHLIRQGTFTLPAMALEEYTA